MQYECNMDWWSNLASILTFIVTLVGVLIGIFGYLKYHYNFYRKNKRLEEYLKELNFR